MMKSLLSSFALAVAIVIPLRAAEPAPAEKPNPHIEGLKVLHKYLKEYRALTGEAPESLEDVLRTTSLDDRQVFFLPESLGSRLVKQWPQWATPDFRLLPDHMDQPWAVSIDGQSGIEYGVKKDGTIVENNRGFDSWYGYSMGGGEWRYEATEEELRRHTARLGLILKEVETDDNEWTAVYVVGVIPGFQRTGMMGLSDFRRSDRLLNLNGHVIRSIDDAERFLVATSDKRPSMIIIRDGKPLMRWAMTPLPGLANKGEDVANIARKAEVIISEEGPGRLGCDLESSEGAPRVKLVREGSGAANAGIKAGDVIRAIGDRPVKDYDDLIQKLRFFRAGETVALDIARGERLDRVGVVLGAQEPFVLTNQRFQIHFGQLNEFMALKYAGSVIPRDVVNLMVANGEGEVYSAKKWLDESIKEPTAYQKILMPQLFELRGELHEQLKEFDKAEADHDQCIALTPGNLKASALEKKAQFLLRRKRLDDAVQVMRQVVEDAESYQKGMMIYRLANMLRDGGRREEAVAECRKLLNDPQMKDRAAELLKMLEE